MTLSAGTKLGPYEILSPLGAGGMGEVYKARDTRLGREVAVKVLSGAVASSPEHLRRFEQEARSASALSDPHIVTVFDVGEQDGVHYFATELVEGGDLRSRLGLEGIPVKKVLEIAEQIAAGLAAAHERGITHRDLKPENILLTKSGQAKIADFGLAKLSETPDSEVSQMPTVNRVETTDGVVMGTVSYMSPEQAAGRKIDYRSDQFSFGLILYEMLTGRLAFKKETKGETLAAILRDDPPPIAESNAAVAAPIAWIVERCLAKDPEDRYASTRDLAKEISNFRRRISEVTSSGRLPAATAAAEPTLGGIGKAGWASILALVLVAAGLLAGRLLWRERPILWKGTLLGGPEFAMSPRISPDGHTLAFEVMVKDNTQVAVMKPESGNWQVLTHKADAGYVTYVAWSADGNRIYYDRSADVPLGVYSVPVLGGDEQLLLENASVPEPLPDGSLLLLKLNAARELQLHRFWPDSGRLSALPLIFNSEIFAQLRVSPGGREAVAIGRRTGPGGDATAHLYSIDLGSDTMRRIPTGYPDDSLTAISTSPDGRSLLVAATSGDVTTLVRIPRQGRRPSRPLFTLTESVHYVDCAADGTIYAGAETYRPNIVRFPAEGGRATRIGAPADAFFGAMFPLGDGRVVVQQHVAGRARLVAVESGKDPVPLVTTSEETAAPATRAGNDGLAFLIGAEPRRTIAVASFATGRVTRRVPFDKGPIHSLAASPDGATLYAASGGSVWSIPASGEPKRICAGESVAADPGGKALLVQVVEEPRQKLLRVPLDGGPARQIPLNGPFHLTFDPLSSAGISRDGQRMLVPMAALDDWFFVPGTIDLSSGRMSRIPTDWSGDYHAIGWAPGGEIVAMANEARATIWKFTPEKR